MKRALLIVALAAVGAGCSTASGEGETANSTPPPEGMPYCDDLFQPEQTIEEDQFGLACRTPTEEIDVPLYVELECHDDTTLVWNDYAWGYVGQPMTMWPPEERMRVPAEQAMTCRQGMATDLIEGTPTEDGEGGDGGSTDAPGTGTGG